MRKLGLVLLSAVLVLSTAGTAMATHGYQLVGIGQIQESMGGAVTAAPMDAMTAITNPAGMARIGTRADFSMEAFMPNRSVDFKNIGGVEDFGLQGGDREEGGTDLYGIPSIGWTAPAFGRDDVYFGGGMFATSGLGVDYGEVLILPGSTFDAIAQSQGAPAGVFTQDVTFDGHSAIQFWKIAPTVAWNVNDKTSVGLSLNFDYQSVSITEVIRNILPDGTDADGDNDLQEDISLDLGRPTSQMGVGATVGAIYDVNSWLTLGSAYASKQFFPEGEFNVGTNDILNFNGAVGKAGTYELDLEYPQQFSVGAAVKPIDKWLVALDVRWIDWSGTHDSVTLTGPSDSFDTNGDGVGDSDSTELAFGWDDTWAYSLGVQFTPIKELALRAGYSYAKSPIQEEDVFNNLVFPAIVEQHVSLGADYRLGKHWGIGATYMHVFEQEITGEGDISPEMQAATGFGEDSNAVISLEEDSIGMHLSYIF